MRRIHLGNLGPPARPPTCAKLVAYRLLLLVLAALFLPAACDDGSPPPASTLAVPDCTVAAIPGLIQAPTPPNPLDAFGSVVSPGAPAGTLPGAGSVTPTGEYRYRIPLDVPPGRAGMAPSLALTYSSRGKNGHLGVGWQIEGLSEIARCPRTFAVDGVSFGVRLDEHDALCLDGHELVAIGAAKAGGCAGQEYRTEGDTFARIVSCGVGNAVASFTVSSKDGHVRVYTPLPIPSAYPAAEVPGDNPPGGTVNFVWLLSTDQDRAGNSIHYAYTSQIQPFGAASPGGPAIEYDPSRIDYTFQETTGEAGRRSIVFGYEARPDPSFSYVAGVQVNVTQRLTTIEAWAPSPTTPAKVWQYDLAYETSTGSGASLLTSVQRCGALGGCLPAKQLGWQQSTGAQYDTFHLKHSGLVGAPLVLDLDGDGRDDVLYATSSGEVDVLTTTDPTAPLAVERYAGGAAGSLDLTTARPIDLDGDGRDEVVVPGVIPDQYDVHALGSSLAAASSVPLAFSTSHVPIPGAGSLGMTPAYFADLDGDGLPDMVQGDSQPKSGTWRWSFELNRGALVFSSPVGIGDEFIAPLGILSSFAMDQGQHRATIFYGAASAGTAPGELVGFVLDTQGSPIPVNPPAPPGTGPSAVPPLTAFADMNGDGLQEQIAASRSATGVTIGVSGNNWPGGIQPVSIPWQEPSAFDTSQVSLQIADVDGDGRDDVVVAYRGNPARAWVVRLGAAGQLELGTLPGPPDAIGDFDGDGLLDLLVAPQGAATDWTLYRQKGRGTTDQLTTVSDAGGGAARETVTYATSFSSAPRAAPEPPAPSGCAYPQRCMRHGFSVVREHDVYQGDAVAAPGPAYQRRRYDYEGARFDVRGRGFLGFDTVRQWEPDRQAETVTTYDDTTMDGTVYPGAGRPKHVRRAVILPGSG